MIRPFFSVVIPCYNSKKTIGRLLQSIVDQNMLKYDIEVVLADDCSTESYQQEIKPFLNRLLIKQIKTDYNCGCPGNTRQRGIDNATGQWVVFSDHDDYFEPNIFPIIKKQIKKQTQQINIIYTLFKHIFPDGNYDIIDSERYGWTHGKFFNLDNFWNKYHVHFIKDLISHQDVSISTQLQCIQIEHPQLLNLKIDMITYNWIGYQESTSNKSYKQPDEDFERPFLDIFYNDYLYSTLGILLQKYKQYNYNNKKYYEESFLNTILLAYFYMQYNLFHTEKYLKRNYDKIREYLLQILQLCNMNIEKLYNYYTKENIKLFSQTMKDSIIATDYIPYPQTLKEWLEIVYYGKY